MNLSENLKLVHYAARRVHNRILSSGLRAEYDDVFQDTAMVWLDCEEKFDKEKGYKFSTYFVSAANFSVFSSYQKKNNRFQSTLTHFGEGEGEVEFDPADMSVTAEEELCVKEWIAESSLELSPLAKRMLAILTNPPVEILDSLEAMKAKAEYARERGSERRACKELNLTSLCKILNVSGWNRRLLNKEMKRVFHE